MNDTTLDYALKYLECGWLVVPAPPRSKNPGDAIGKGWQDLRLKKADLPKYFSNGNNVGLLLGDISNGLIDIDCDWPEARALASQFLPETKLISGRETCPHSHFWYVVVEPIKTIQLQDPTIKDKDERAMIVELRSKGAQTLVAPSIHPSGDKYLWNEFREPTKVDAKTLLKCVYRLAACALLARHWQYGQRHHTALALSSVLLRSGWSVSDTEHFILSAAIAANDEEAQERVKNVITTQQRIESSEPFTGLPKLIELLGEKIIEKLRLWLNFPLISKVQSKPNYQNRNQPTEKPPSKVVCLADVKPEQVEYLWYPYIPKGKFTIIEGDPGVGKSWLTCALATATAAGKGIEGWRHNEPSNVLMLSVEDGLSDTIRPRLDSMHADVKRIFALEGALVFNDAGLLDLETKLIDYKPALVIVDPIVAYLGAGVDIHRANEVRAITSQLALLAEKYHCAVAGVRHLTKGGKDKAIYRGIGSIDFTAACRSVLLVGCDPEDQSKRVIAQTKNNLSEKGVAIGYEIIAGVFYWTGESSVTEEQLLAPTNFGNSQNETSEAKAFLKEVLAEGAMPVREVEKEARLLGITPSQLRTARNSLGVKSKKQGQPGTEGQAWVWFFPDPIEDDKQSENLSEDVRKEQPSHLRANFDIKSLYVNDLTEDANTASFSHLRQEESQLRDEFMACPVDGKIGKRLSYCEKCGEFLH